MHRNIRCKCRRKGREAVEDFIYLIQIHICISVSSRGTANRKPGIFLKFEVVQACRPDISCMTRSSWFYEGSGEEENITCIFGVFWKGRVADMQLIGCSFEEQVNFMLYVEKHVCEDLEAFYTQFDKRVTCASSQPTLPQTQLIPFQRPSFPPNMFPPLQSTTSSTSSASPHP